MVDVCATRFRYDILLAQSPADRSWARALKEQLEGFGLRVSLEDSGAEAGGRPTTEPGGAILQGRCLVLILEADSCGHPPVRDGWTSLLAAPGPAWERLVTVVLDACEPPPFLAPFRRIAAADRDAARVARELAEMVGRGDDSSRGGPAATDIGEEFVFTLDREGDDVVVRDPTGRARSVPPPWAVDDRFRAAWARFARLMRRPINDDREAAEIHEHAATLGRHLAELILDGPARDRLRRSMRPGSPRPVLRLCSDDDLLLALPWELLHDEGRFLVRDGVVDLVRATPGEAGEPAPPDAPFSLVVNVSAPEGSVLDHERESYRVTLALTAHCKLTPTELGTLDDLVETVRRAAPTGLHFSGHGLPGWLLFEDDEGRGDPVGVDELLGRLRGGQPGGRLPPFFYLANCHGNDPDPGAPEPGRAGTPGLAAQLHRAGVREVVGYRGPVNDRLSTEAEAALYAAIAEGHPTRHAVRRARAAISAGGGGGLAGGGYPFAWAQLVLYRRGPDVPLGTPVPPDPRGHGDATPRRDFVDAGTRRLLRTGFIGRRRELHDLRRRHRRGQRAFVLQGLGGLGKSTLGLEMASRILHAGGDLCTLWCQDAATADTVAGIGEALVGGLLDFGRRRLGPAWEEVVPHIDRRAGDGPAERFEAYLRELLARVGRLVVYLDNLESLLDGPDAGEGRPDPGAFGRWKGPELAGIWGVLARCAEGPADLHVVASCRYRHADFGPSLVPVAPLPDDALFRLTGWLDALGRLSAASRARLTARLDGHPRAVEYANDLVRHELARFEGGHGPWRLPEAPSGADLDREWSTIVAPTLPAVRDRLWGDLLLAALWDRALDDRGRRMLARMALLRGPWDAEIVGVLGEPGDDPCIAEATAEGLLRSSLLEEVELPTGPGALRLHAVHPATAAFAACRDALDADARRDVHRRIGDWYDARAQASGDLGDQAEAGHHLFQAGEYDRAAELLCWAAVWLQDRGHHREVLLLLEPFLAGAAHASLGPAWAFHALELTGNAELARGRAGRAIGRYEQALELARALGDRRGEAGVLGNLGIAFKNLGQAEQAIDYHERALAVARAVGDRRVEACALGNLGVAHAALGRSEPAIGYYEQQLALAREIGNRRLEGNALGGLGREYADLGRHDRAGRCHEQALAIARELGDRRGEGQTLSGLGHARVRRGAIEPAIEYYEQALAIARELGNRRDEADALGDLGVAHAAVGRPGRAVGYQEQALAIARELGDRRGEGRALANLGLACKNLGEPGRAFGYYQQALAIAREVTDPVMADFARRGIDATRHARRPGGGPDRMSRWWRRLAFWRIFGARGDG